MFTKVSTGTQFDSAFYADTCQKIIGSTKRQDNYDIPVLYDYLDLENAMDLDKLKTWCHSYWFTTIRAALINRNRLQYHACCNSFSRRNFIRHADHPAEETFEVHKLRDFKNIET